jgi:glycerophosphoryl diester phosphodiesterase
VFRLKNKILALLLAGALWLSLPACTVTQYPEPVSTPSPTSEPTPAPTPVPTSAPAPVLPTYIVHAGGAFRGYVSTNSKEALVAAYNTGMRYIELDFSLTSDGEPVCLHDWNTGILPNYPDTDFPLSLEAFVSARLYGELTPLTLDDLADFVARHEDVFIITDTKDDNLAVLRILAERYPALLPQFIPQIYREEELAEVRALGFADVIYTLYAADWDAKLDTAHIAAFAAENDIWCITFPCELTEIEGYVEGLLRSGVPLYTHTVNEPEAIEAQLALGITGVYIDQYRQ